MKSKIIFLVSLMVAIATSANSQIFAEDDEKYALDGINKIIEQENDAKYSAGIFDFVWTSNSFGGLSVGQLDGNKVSFYISAIGSRYTLFGPSGEYDLDKSSGVELSTVAPEDRIKELCAATGGLTKRVLGPFWLTAGAGFGHYSMFDPDGYQINGTIESGLTYELGAVISLKWINFFYRRTKYPHQWQNTFGVGLSFPNGGPMPKGPFED